VTTRSIRTIVGAMSAIAAAAMIAGCAGSQVNPSAGQPRTAMQAHSPIGLPAVKNHCDAHGGVRVTPCTVTFDASDLGPDTVVIRTPKTKKGTLTESDDCGGASGVATVAQGSGKDWTVTAGATAGTCSAEFDFLNFKHNKKVGYAILSITNNL
jgi:hypothetical protein